MRTLRLFEQAGRALLRLAPPAFRAAWEDELVATIRESCLAAHRADGWRGLVFAGMLELSNVGGSAVRLRLGGPAPLTAGTPRPPRHRPGKGARLMMLLANDCRLALRSLWSSRLVTGIAVLTLALGIGVNAAVFSILDSALFRPMPFAGADRYEEIWNLNLRSKFSYPGFRRAVLNEWRRQTDLYDRVEGYEIASFVHDAAEGAEMLTGAYVTPGLMSLLGVPPIAGRTFGEGDGRDGTSDLLVLSEELWRARFNADPGAIGQTLSFNGRRHTIVGVMPKSFRFPTGAGRFWVPYDPTSPPADPSIGPQTIVALARRAPGVTAEQSATAVSERGERVAQAAGQKPGLSAKVGFSQHMVDARTGTSLLVLGGAVGFLLLIVCANLANLTLSRALTRARDFAIRASLGASRGDLVRETLIEHLIIGLLGAGLGLIVARGVLELTLVRLPEGLLVRSLNIIDLDGRTLAFAAAIGVLTALLFGLPPAWLASRSRVAHALKAQSRSSTGSRAARRLRSTLVIAEVTLAIVLLAGAALMARSFVKLQHVDRGFDSSGLVIVRAGLPAAGYTDLRARDGFTEALLDRARKLPGVTGATAGFVPPDSSIISCGELEFADRPGQKTESLVLPIYKVWPNYFDVVGIPIRAGRAFAGGEPADSVIVSESFARQYFADGGAVGRQFRFEGAKSWRTIVGVAGEVRQLDLDDQHGSFEFYYPLMQPAAVLASAAPAATRVDPIVEYRSVVVRGSDAGAMVDRLRAAVHEVDARVVVWRADVVDQLFADAVARPRLVMLMMTVFAGMGLVLAAAGIYGVLSYLVAQRRREIGIRLALGARPSAVGMLILRNGLQLTLVGLAIGSAAAFGLVRVMRTLLYEVEPSDPVSLAAVSGLLLATALSAAWWPARRAMRVDPVGLLREE